MLLLADVFRVTYLYNTMLKWVKLLAKIILNYIIGGSEAACASTLFHVLEE